jgi:uncharacterized delta-60 repeat protein
MGLGRRGFVVAALISGAVLLLCAIAPAAGPRVEIDRLPPRAGDPWELLAYSSSKLLLLDSEEETIVRVENDGSLDASFGDDGRIKRFSRGVAVDQRGRILLAGSGISSGESPTGFDAEVVRLLPNGSPDRSFGTNGVALVDLGGAHDEGNTVAVAPDGRIIVGGVRHRTGSSRGPAPGDPAVARFLPNGSLDQSFGHEGVRILPGGWDYGVANLVPTRSGGIVAEGEGYLGISIWRLSRSGSLIRSFGQDGEVELAARTFPSGIKAYLVWSEQIGVLPDGRIVAVASAERFVAGQTEYRAMVVCLEGRGRIDHSFGDGGWKTVDFGGSSFIESLTMLPGGVTLVAGEATRGRRDVSDAVAAAIGPDGTLEPGFGRRGTIRLGAPVSTVDMTTQGVRAVALAQSKGERNDRLIRFPTVSRR